MSRYKAGCRNSYYLEKIKMQGQTIPQLLKVTRIPRAEFPVGGGYQSCQGNQPQESSREALALAENTPAASELQGGGKELRTLGSSNAGGQLKKRCMT